MALSQDSLCLACLQVLLLVVPGGAKAKQVDEAGLSSLAVLRLMGLPGLQVLVQGQAEGSLKDRSAAKKRAQAAVASQVQQLPSALSGYFLLPLSMQMTCQIGRLLEHCTAVLGGTHLDTSFACSQGAESSQTMQML